MCNGHLLISCEIFGRYGLTDAIAYYFFIITSSLIHLTSNVTAN